MNKIEDNLSFNNIGSTEGFVPMEDRNFPDFRRQIYLYLKRTLSVVLTENELDIVVKLISEIFGDLYMRAGLLPWQIDTDRCSDDNLEALSSLIGYTWQKGLTIEQQRVGIDMYLLIRKNRGTTFGLENLVRSYGQTIKDFYSAADLRGIRIIEYHSGGPETVEPSMFPGDIIVEVPDMSSLLRDSIRDTQLAGTRLFFSYIVFVGVYFSGIRNFGQEMTIYITPDKMIQGYDPVISALGPFGLDTKIEQIIEYQITHGIRGNNASGVCEIGHTINSLDNNHVGNVTCGMQLLTYYQAPFINGFILNTPGLTNYRGFIQPLGVIEKDYILYQ